MSAVKSGGVLLSHYRTRESPGIHGTQAYPGKLCAARVALARKRLLRQCLRHRPVHATATPAGSEAGGAVCVVYSWKTPDVPSTHVVARGRRQGAEALGPASDRRLRPEPAASGRRGRSRGPAVGTESHRRGARSPSGRARPLLAQRLTAQSVTDPATSSLGGSVGPRRRKSAKPSGGRREAPARCSVAQRPCETSTGEGFGCEFARASKRGPLLAPPLAQSVTEQARSSFGGSGNPRRRGSLRSPAAGTESHRRGAQSPSGRARPPRGKAQKARLRVRLGQASVDFFRSRR